MKNCNYCGDSDKTCEECGTIICEECYNVVNPYEDDNFNFNVIYLCNKCIQKY